VVIRLVALLAAIVASTPQATPSERSAPATERFVPLSEPGDAIPAIPLRAQDGRAFDFANLRGSAVAVAFIYTRCRDARICPLVSAKFARAQFAIGSAPIRLVLLTLDPGYDTPQVLARYGRVFGQDPRYWTLATGARASIDELAGRLGIAGSTSEPGSIVHTEAAVIIGPDGRVARTIAGNAWSPADLIDYARATLPSGGGPFIAVRAWLGGVVERCGASGIGLGGPAMLGILGGAIAGIGVAFWFAFAGKPVSPR
jgi:protein SCO1/2